MLRLVKLLTARPSARTVTPAMIEPLMVAAQQGGDPTAIVKDIISGWGFDSFLCGWGSAARPDRESFLYAFTTLPSEWTSLYDQEHYVEVDPRIHSSEEMTALITWSAEDFRGRNTATDKFLADAARFGVCSGACFGWREHDGNGILVAYNSKRARIDAEMVRSVADELYAFGHAFHDVFMRTVIEKGLPSRLRGVALSRREVEALQYAARGLTVQDIAPKMGISPRTVRFHIDSASTKLGAMKREEAIALAVKGGLLNVLP